MTFWLKAAVYKLQRWCESVCLRLSQLNFRVKSLILELRAATQRQPATEENTTLKEEKEILTETFKSLYETLEEVETALTDLQDDVEGRL